MANGWTLERRARQAARIRTWKPWERSTGARTAAGKARSSRNADKPESLKRQMLMLKKEVASMVSQAMEIRGFFASERHPASIARRNKQAI